MFRTKEYLGPSITRGNEGGSGTIVLKEPGVTQYPHHNEKSVFVFLETLVDSNLVIISTLVGNEVR